MEWFLNNCPKVGTTSPESEIEPHSTYMNVSQASVIEQYKINNTDDLRITLQEKCV